MLMLDCNFDHDLVFQVQFGTLTLEASDNMMPIESMIFASNSWLYGVMCRPEWQELCSRAQESEKEHMERLKFAGLLFHSRVIKPGEHPVDVLQALLYIPRSEAVAIALASGLSGSPPVPPSGDAVAATALPYLPVNQGGAGNAAEQEHGPLVEPQLLQLPIGFTISTYLERRHKAADNLRVMFRGECPKHNCAVKLHSFPSLRSFVDKHAACRCTEHPLSTCYCAHDHDNCNHHDHHDKCIWSDVNTLHDTTYRDTCHVDHVPYHSLQLLDAKARSTTD